MNYSVFRFTLNMHGIRSQASVSTFRGDTAVRLNINLTDGGNTYYIEDGCTAWLSGTKPDGTKLWHRCAVINNTTIQYDFLAQTTSITGMINCEIILYGADGNEITAPKFTIVVDEREVNDIDFPEEGESILAGIALAEDARVTAETARAAAETARTKAESTRVTSETSRTGAEGARVVAETARVTAEQERVTAETARAVAETARATAEANRVKVINHLTEHIDDNTVKALTATPAEDFGVFNISATLGDGSVLTARLDLPLEAIRIADVDDFIDGRGDRCLRVEFSDPTVEPLIFKLDEIFGDLSALVSDKLDAGELNWNGTTLYRDSGTIKSSWTGTGFSAEDTSGQSVKMGADSVIAGSPTKETKYTSGCIALSNHDNDTTATITFPNLPDGTTTTLATLDDIEAVMSQTASSEIYNHLNIPFDVKFTLKAGVEHYTADHPIMLNRKKGETYFIKVMTDNPNPLVLYERSSANGNLAIMNLSANIEYEVVASQDFESLGFYIAPMGTDYTYCVHYETPESVSSARLAGLKESLVTKSGLVHTTGTSETAVMSQKATTEAIKAAEGKTDILAEQILGKGRNNFVTPQMFGSNATGTGIVDDTAAFYEALSHGNNIYLPEGTYIIDFRCIDLTGKTIRGASASKTTIMQKNSNVPFCQVGNGTMIENLTIHMRQNTERTACLAFGMYGGTFVAFTDHRIEKVNLNCDSNTVAFHYAMHGPGCVGGEVRDIVINGCHIGIWVDMTGVGWLTSHRFENFNIYRPQVAGVKITDANNQGQHTQSQYLNISVMNYNDGAIGFDIGSCGVMFINPTCFIENSEGTTYSIKIDESVALKQKQTAFNVTLFVGGLLEGKVINKDYFGLAKFDNCLFVLGANLSNPGATYPSLNSTIRPITRDIVKDYGNNTSGISNSNATITHGVDEFGSYIEFSRTDEAKKASIIFNAGSSAALGDEVTSYPVSTFYSVIGINFDHTLLTQLYDTGLGNSSRFVTLRSRIDVPSADNEYLCIRTLIDDWTQHEQYKVHNMQMQIEAGAPTGSKVRIYKYCVNYGITPAPQSL